MSAHARLLYFNRIRKPSRMIAQNDGFGIVATTATDASVLTWYFTTVTADCASQSFFLNQGSDAEILPDWYTHSCTISSVVINSPQR